VPLTLVLPGLAFCCRGTGCTARAGASPQSLSSRRFRQASVRPALGPLRARPYTVASTLECVSLPLSISSRFPSQRASTRAVPQRQRSVPDRVSPPSSLGWCAARPPFPRGRMRAVLPTRLEPPAGMASRTPSLPRVHEADRLKTMSARSSRSSRVRRPPTDMAPCFSKCPAIFRVGSRVFGGTRAVR